uniref:hypothetical protein n=1 Tax=Scandinavium goeteborgense TaxID=1851514 RepID=UPI001359F1D7|nr:hypothetical protein [Scandinavium goeteborgense]
MKVYLYLLAAIFSFSCNAVAEQEVITAGYKGTVGKQLVGMTLIVDDKQIITNSHYYYFKHITDIPLTGIAGTSIKAQEPGGGTFELHFIGNGSNGNVPLSFENSIGLSGTWTGPGGKVLPVMLSGGGTSGPADPPGTRWYQSVTSNKSDQEFEAQVKGFYDAVMTDNRMAATKFVTFPLRVNFTPEKHTYIHNSREFIALWDHIFSPTWLKMAKNEAPHDMGISNNLAALGQGLAYFGEDGVEVINAEP